MNPSIIRFHHFATVESYCKLQEIFGAYDEKRRYEAIKEPFEDFEITYYERDEFCDYEDYKELSFIRDFILPNIESLKKRYFENYKSATYSKNLFTNELLEGYSKFYLNKLIETKNLIFKADYISVLYRDVVLTQIEELETLINEFVKNPYPEIKEKIQFNWNRTDIEYFFHLLRENGETSWIEDADLGRIIDSTIEFKSDNEYLPINDSRKHLNEFKNTAARSTNKSNERLKNIFMNEDFYNL